MTEKTRLEKMRDAIEASTRLHFLLLEEIHLLHQKVAELERWQEEHDELHCKKEMEK